MSSRAAVCIQMWWFKKMRRRQAAEPVLVLLLIICLGACRKGENEQMLAYMERKYGEAFVEKEIYAGQFGEDYTMLRMQSKSRPGEDILVRVLRREKPVFQDNYLSILLQKEVEEKINTLAKPVFGECRVFYKIPELVLPADFPADMEADTFLRHPLAMVRVHVYARFIPEDVRKQFQDFYTSLKEKGYLVSGVISYPADEESYRVITRENFRSDIYRGYKSQTELLFSMDENGELSLFRQITNQPE